MKKLAVSLFAILAIVFAVASAFSTVKKSTTTVYTVYGASTFSSSPDVNELESEGDVIDQRETTPFDLINDPSFTPFCSPNSTICLGQVEDDGTPIVYGSLKTGTYDPE
jgi:hypothetical protein